MSFKQKWGNDIRTGLRSLISNSTSNFSGAWQPPPPDTAQLTGVSVVCRKIMQPAAKWPLRANKSLPKFTPIFLILPQTLVVCQNWLASNLEKDILRKCQKCRRMEDKSDLCSLVCPDHFKFTCLLWHEFFHAHPSKIYNFWWAHAIFGKNNSVLSALEDELWSRDHESFSNV